MVLTVVLCACSAFVVAVIACGVTRAVARRLAWLDQPNERSLHTVPVPRLGGVGITLATWVVSVCALLSSSATIPHDMRVWLLASLPIAALGGIDDVRPLSTAVRFVIQISVAAAFAIGVGVPREVLVSGSWSVAASTSVYVLASVVWIVGVLNIFNFMDGMDGLAGSQAVFASLAWAAVAALRGHTDIALVAAAIAGANAGFLVHNSSPASIFMGDAGSTFLGFTFAGFAVMECARAAPIPFVVAPIALAPFLLDGTFTLLRRALRGEKFWRAHRTHLYQRAVQTELAHRDVLVPYAAWMALASVAAVLASRARTMHVAVLSAGLVAVLVGVHRWVLARERARGASAK